MKNLETWVKFDQQTEAYGIFEMSPVERGMGLTIGNSLRRVLLSSLEGVAPIRINIEGVRHEFDAIDGVQEDVLDIIFNLKSVVFSIFEGEEAFREVSLNVSGEKDVTAADLELPSDVKVLNPDQHIVSLNTKKASLNLTFVIERNIGYRPSEDQNKEGLDISTIYLDSSFSPIDRVNHRIEDVRVGQELNYDKLILEVWTNGSITTELAVKQVSSILMDRLGLFGELNRKPVFVDVNDDEDDDDQQEEAGVAGVGNLSVDDLELSARSLNCLKKANINTVSELVKKDLNDLYNIKNFGKKSAEEINAKLKEYDLALNGGVE